MSMSKEPIAPHHILVLGLCGLVLAGGLLLDAGPDSVSLGGLSLPSICWYRSTPLGGCPGCGLTRSAVAFCHLRWRESLEIHPGGCLVVLLSLLEIPHRLSCLRRGSRGEWQRWISRAIGWSWLGVLFVGLANWLCKFMVHSV